MIKTGGRTPGVFDEKKKLKKKHNEREIIKPLGALIQDETRTICVEDIESTHFSQPSVGKSSYILFISILV